jgi:hypothetical protein
MSCCHLLRLLACGTVSYQAQGHQYVAVVSGYVGVYNTIAPKIGGANSTVTYSRLKSSATMRTLILTLFVAAINARLAI